jgi:hypothetical protein
MRIILIVRWMTSCAYNQAAVSCRREMYFNLLRKQIQYHK